MPKYIIIWLAAMLNTSLAQIYLPADERINGKLVWEAFEPQREVLQQSSAVVYTDEKFHVKAVYGVIVSEEGHILTKASEIEDYENLGIRVGRELYEDVELVSTDTAWDVALLKINSETEFVPVVFSSSDIVSQGHWVVSNGSSSRSTRRVRVGVVSAETREIKAGISNVVLGVMLDAGEGEEIKVTELTPDGGAELAGVKVGDIIESVDGKELVEILDIWQALKGKIVGDILEVGILRGEEKLKIEVELTARSEDPAQISRNDMMSGGNEILSERRDGFERVIHHDTPLSHTSVGGPLLNLDGECIGMNIARASRVATFAIPVPELREIIARMVP
ncbi:MAG: trypsin-like peptidase domain-containing protein [Akkermansiaceae bacterium]